MSVTQIFFSVLALSVPVVGLIVVVRLLHCAWLAVRASRSGQAALAVLGVVVMAALFAAVVAVWFGYAVAHSKKDLWTDLAVAALTVLPFHAAAYGFWRMVARFRRAASVAGGATAAGPRVSEVAGERG